MPGANRRNFRRRNPSRRNHYNRFARRFPSYSFERWRPRASDRDRAFWVSLDDDEEECPYPTSGISEDIEECKPEVPPAELATKLHVKGIDLHIDENAQAHHTDRYECNKDRTRTADSSQQKAELVIRRGQDFKMTIKFDRPYSIKKNDITLTFNMGDDYKPKKRLSACFKVDETGKNTSYKPKKWGATVVEQKDNSLTLAIFVPASVPIGEWEFSVRTIVDADGDGKDLIWQYNHNEDINIIFNPWCKEDCVFMKDEVWRQEAVLNDSGVQYNGLTLRLGAKPWNYGQFEGGILDAAFHLVRKSFNYRACPGMGNAPTVARLISQIVNSSDDDGVLTGKWGGRYWGGTSPTAWNGSPKILRQYMEKGRPVKYGQCWVFSAVVTTVCRALGIPCRSVTNYASAHNTDKDALSIDVWKKKDEQGDWIVVKDDSVWNFHVWNEAWMARPDLDDNHKWDGWQVIDATPQEQSDGVFCCGPAPVKAIKEGEITVGSDGDFIFAEVNADRVHWKEDESSGKIFQEKRIRNSIGKLISTHLPTGRSYRGASLGKPDANTMERLDLTNEYKYEAGSKQEREITKKAERIFRTMNSGTDFNLHSDDEDETPQPLEITFEDPGELFVGTEFDFIVHLKNVTASTMAGIDLVVKVFYKTYFDSYTGMAALKKFKCITLESGKVETFKIPMEEKITMARPEDSFNFEVMATASICDNSDCVDNEFKFRLRRPDIQLKGPDTCGLSDQIKIEAIFSNPLSVPLTDCKIDLEGPFEFLDPCPPSDSQVEIPDIAPGKEWCQTFLVRPKLFPKGQKDREMTVGFESRQLQEIVGYHAVEIKN